MSPLEKKWSRPDRGHLSRPTVKEVMAYRQHVTEKTLQLSQNRASIGNWNRVVENITLGIAP